MDFGLHSPVAALTEAAVLCGTIMTPTGCSVPGRMAPTGGQNQTLLHQQHNGTPAGTDDVMRTGDDVAILV